MEIIQGSKRETTIKGWDEIITKRHKRLNDSIACYKTFHELSDIEHVLKDLKEFTITMENLKKVYEYMNEHGIQ